MNNAKIDKSKQINDIVSTVKLASLLFTGIILFKYVFVDDVTQVDFPFAYYELISFLLPLVILLLIYFIWTFSTKNKLDSKYNNLINKGEIFTFILLFSIIIYISGANESNYKFLYLFIIITTTIQSGMKYGLVTSIISSIIILAIDLIMMPATEVNIYFENDLILAGIFILTAWPLGFYVKIEGEHIKRLENMVNFDGLTNVYNHRYFQDKLKEKVEIGRKEDKPVSMIFIDIDYFKHYNDLYGHQKGDNILRELAVIVTKSVREKDIVARYGGEEFAVILEDTTEKETLGIAERIRANVEETYFDGEENQPKGKITASIGISIFPDKAKDELELIKSADDALYRAKFFNKNRVETYTSILDDLKKNIDDKDIELVTSIKTLISIINAKDRYTYSHVERVVIYSRLLADKLKLSEIDKSNLIYGAYMHDIGKINIPKEILVKRMKLEKDEWEELKQHPDNGVEIIKSVESLKDVIPLIKHHHERYDGKGYPNGLTGKEIPYLARVLTVVDSFDAMTSNRPYNRRKSYEEGIEELRKCSGAQFDPEIAKAFIEVIESNAAFL
ncbi:Probable diguanylate cyclase YcdT [uncultured Clostridium sp.]|uniref:bifunctional diguanylate cyclase/phosphohydrolase n=1 Tax=uncultured Clostridium sp. TaxID=59620 RepID=UPI000822439D|nr:diguanylate cyclase [uncultured Clostridium sp.]SCJ98916.1 Probable diguanylate cyclase YcdT [uncultured Clostridium sp.]